MTDMHSILVKSASGSLTMLTKIRCVEEFRLPQDVESKNIFSWPNTRYLEADEVAFLESRDVCLRHSYIKTFSVPYKLYDEMKKVDVSSVDAIKATRSLLDVFQIVSGGKAVTGITAAWVSEEHPTRTIPTCLSDTKALSEFGKHKDSFLVFQREGEKYDIKLRPCVLPIVLREIPQIRDYPITHRDLREFVSSRVDLKGRKNRNIVFQANSDYFRSVVNQTVDAVEKLVGNQNLCGAVKKSFAIR
jgi:hypothetical protein